MDINPRGTDEVEDENLKKGKQIIRIKVLCQL